MSKYYLVVNPQGNAMKMASLVRIEDGLIDLLIVRKASRLKLLSLF